MGVGSQLDSQQPICGCDFVVDKRFDCGSVEQVVLVQVNELEDFVCAGRAAGKTVRDLW